MTNKEIYKKLENFKKENSLSFKEIGNKLGLSETTVSDKFGRIKNNKNVSYKFLIEFETAFNVSIFFKE